MSISQPGRAPVDPDDRSNYLAGRIFAAINSVLVNGVQFASTFKNLLLVETTFAKTDTTARAVVNLASSDGGSGAQLALTGGASQSVRRFRVQTTDFAGTFTGVVDLQGLGGTVSIPSSQLTPDSFTAVSFANSWTDFDNTTYSAASYMKDAHGRVWLRGFLKSGTIGSAAFTLPAGYRPLKKKNLVAATSTGGGVFTFGIATVDTSGNVVPAVGNNQWFAIDSLNWETW